jgi:hypothetical protein
VDGEVSEESEGTRTGEVKMVTLLWIAFLVLLVLWLVGFAVNWGAFIWILLIIALVALLLNVIGALTRRRWY